MPKSVFTDGVTAVVASFLNEIFTHVHDGVDQDGSAPKVDLENHTNLDFGAASPKGLIVANAGGVLLLSSTPSITDNRNLSSVTRTGMGQYEVDLDTTALPDIPSGSYWGVAVASVEVGAATGHTVACRANSLGSRRYVELEVRNSAGSLVDPNIRCNLAVFANRT